MASVGQIIEFGPYLPSGVLAGGAKIYHYSAGTATLKDVYTDRAKTTTAAQPVVADANGMASFYADGLYKFVVDTAADVTLYTLDNFAVGDVGVASLGEARLALSGANLVLSRRKGSYLTIDGANQQIASGGVSLAPTALTPGTVYNIYAYMNSGTMTLEASTTATATHTDGTLIKNADSTRAYVGYWKIVTGPAWETTTVFDSSWHEPLPLLPRGYLDGLTLSRDTDPDHDLNVTAGMAVDSTGTVLMHLQTEMTKQIDASWVKGDDAGGLSSSLTVANSTSYHIFLIKVGDDIDVGIDTSTTAANLVTDHSATAYRRIGSRNTDGSANILAFSQLGDEVLLDDDVEDVDAAPNSADAQTVTLSVPTGFQFDALFRGHMYDATTVNRQLVFSALDVADASPSIGGGVGASLSNKVAAATAIESSHFRVRTNTSAQIRYRLSAADADTQVVINTYGWIDRRGRDA